MKDYKLTTNRTLRVWEETHEGMAGEPMDVLRFHIVETGEDTNLANVTRYLNDSDHEELSEWADDISASNYSTAIAWVE